MWMGLDWWDKNFADAIDLSAKWMLNWHGMQGQDQYFPVSTSVEWCQMELPSFESFSSWRVQQSLGQMGRRVLEIQYSHLFPDHASATVGRTSWGCSISHIWRNPMGLRWGTNLELGIYCLSNARHGHPHLPNRLVGVIVAYRTSLPLCEEGDCNWLWPILAPGTWLSMATPPGNWTSGTQEWPDPPGKWSFPDAISRDAMFGSTDMLNSAEVVTTGSLYPWKNTGAWRKVKSDQVVDYNYGL